MSIEAITTWEPGLLTMGWGDLRGGLDGVDEPLHVRTLALEDEVSGRRLVIACADVCTISERLRAEVLLRLAARPELGLRPDGVLLTATHTHAGPAGTTPTPSTGCRRPGCRRR